MDSQMISNLDEYRQFAKMYNDNKVFSWKASKPLYKNPTFGNAYIQILDYVNSHPGCFKQDALSMFGGGNFDTLTTLCKNGFILKNTVRVNRKFTYTITSLGKMLLDEAIDSKPVYELMNIAKRCSAFEIFSVELNLNANENFNFNERECLEKINLFLSTHNSLDRKLHKTVAYIDRYLNGETIVC